MRHSVLGLLFFFTNTTIFQLYSSDLFYW